MVRVMMIGEMCLDDWNEKRVKENDQDEADGMKQKVDFKDRVMHIGMSDL